MSAIGTQLAIHDIGVWLRRLVGILERPPWTEHESGGLRVTTVTTLGSFGTTESVLAECPGVPELPLEDGQVNPTQGLVCIYGAMTHDQMAALHALAFGLRVS